MATRKEILHQTLAIMPVNFIEMMMGLGYGWVAPILNQLTNSDSEFSLTSEESSWIASLHYVTRTIGPFFSAFLVDRIGRNRIFKICATIYFLMWVVVFSTRSILIHYLVRLAFGMAVGMFESTTSIYLGENCSPSIRGVCGSIGIVFFYAGELIAFTLAAHFSYEHVALIQAILGLLTLASTFMLKEPAQFLIMKGEVEKAEMRFHWLRNTPDNVEFEKVKQNVQQEESKTSFAELFKPRENYKSLRVVIIVHLLMVCTGFTAITSFVSMAFSSANPSKSETFTILFGVCQFVSVCLSTYAIDRFNRRTLLSMAIAAIIIIQACTAALYYVQNNVHQMPYFVWMVFATITAYSCVFAMTMYPLSTAIRGELLPQSVKALGSSLAISASSATGFLTAKLFLLISDTYGIQTNFGLFSAMSVIMFVYVYFDLPETKGKSLVEIQNVLKK